MNLKEQEYMLALGRHGSLTGAAQELWITQPTLSVFLNHLEESMGVQLFQRVGKKLVPTAAGREYLACAHQMELMKMDFDRKLSQFVREDRGILHVGSMRHRNLYLFPRLIRNFQNIHPGIQVILHDSSPTDLEKMLKDGDLDLILTNQPVENPSLSVRPIYEDRLGMVLGAARAAKLGHHGNWERNMQYLDLREVQEDLFYILPRPHSVRLIAESAFHYMGIHPAHVQEVSNIDLGCQLAAENLGAAFTMESYYRYFSYPKPTKCFFVGDPKLNIKWSIAFRKKATVPSYMKDFMKLLKEQMRDVNLREFYSR